MIDLNLICLVSDMEFYTPKGLNRTPTTDAYYLEFYLNGNIENNYFKLRQHYNDYEHITSELLC